MNASATVEIRRVCVFCGSKCGNKPEYRQAAEDMGRQLARRPWGLVYGGGSIGLMGVIADAVLGAGGEVVGVIPEKLATAEVLHTGLTELHRVASMHARKALMAERSDAFVALPGGYGTFEELFEIITWAQLGIHSKPIGLLNVSGFFDPFLGLVDHAIDEGFIKPKQRNLLLIADEPGVLLEQLARWRPIAGSGVLDVAES